VRAWRRLPHYHGTTKKSSLLHRSDPCLLDQWDRPHSLPQLTRNDRKRQPSRQATAISLP
ncbi:hypothetical protein COCVIDRAFT_86954, partial [Bipolaris victoriae FI3]